MRVAKKSLGKVAKDFLQAVNCGRAALQRRVSDGTYAGFSPGRIGGWPTLSDHRIWVAHSLRCLQRVGFPTLSHLRFVVSQFHANQTFESCGIPPLLLRSWQALAKSARMGHPEFVLRNAKHNRGERVGYPDRAGWRNETSERK